MTQPELEVVWAGGGSFNLLDWNETAYGDVLCEALGEGTEWGNPESIRRTLHRALAAGSALAKDGVENRTVTVRLRLSAADARALAGGEAVLHMLDDQRRVELHWTQPDDYAVPVAFIAVAVDLKRDYTTAWDMDENLVRQTWTLTFTCLPHVRSIEAVEIEAVPPYVATPDTIDDCSAATNWTAVNHVGPAGDVTLAAASGAIEVVAVGSAGPPYTYTFSVVLTDALAFTKPYLAIEVDPAGLALAVSINGIPGTSLALAGVEGAWRFYDLAGEAGATSIRLAFSGDLPLSTQTARILTVGESDSPALTSGRQALRTITTPGSAKADGSLVVESRNAAADGSGDTLGTVIVYTGPDYDPRSSPYSDGVRTPDAAAISGAWETGAAWTFTRPAGSIPVGSYSVWVRASGTPSETGQWTALFGAAAPGSASYITAESIALTRTFDGGGYNLFRLGSIDLPGFDVGVASALDLRCGLIYSGAATVDEMLLFNRSTGRLVVVDTSTVDQLTESGGTWSVTADGGATRLWLDAASLEGEERVIAGSPSKEMSLPMNLNTDMLAYDGSPTFTPGMTFVYVATTGTIDPAVTGEFRPASHSSLAE